MDGPSYAYCVSGWSDGRSGCVVSSLKRKVGALARHGGYHLKVGITNNPEGRLRAHSAKGWRTMHVVYESTSRKAVENVERKLEQHLREECRSRGYNYNLRAGGAGRKPLGSGPQYVYILSGKPYSRIIP